MKNNISIKEIKSIANSFVDYVTQELLKIYGEASGITVDSDNSDYYHYDHPAKGESANILMTDGRKFTLDYNQKEWSNFKEVE